MSKIMYKSIAAIFSLWKYWNLNDFSFYLTYFLIKFHVLTFNMFKFFYPWNALKNVVFFFQVIWHIKVLKHSRKYKTSVCSRLFTGSQNLTWIVIDMVIIKINALQTFRNDKGFLSKKYTNSKQFFDNNLQNFWSSLPFKSTLFCAYLLSLFIPASLVSLQ